MTLQITTKHSGRECPVLHLTAAWCVDYCKHITVQKGDVVVDGSAHPEVVMGMAIAEVAKQNGHMKAVLKRVKSNPGGQLCPECNGKSSVTSIYAFNHAAEVEQLLRIWKGWTEGPILLSGKTK